MDTLLLSNRSTCMMSLLDGTPDGKEEMYPTENCELKLVIPLLHLFDLVNFVKSKEALHQMHFLVDFRPYYPVQEKTLSRCCTFIL
jgi:hypothetical protein